jgi:hypothetical protein
MVKRLGLVVGVLLALACTPSFAAKGWIFSGGLGLTISPETFLITPQLEYEHDNRLSYGPLVQAGVASGGSIFTVSGSVRYVLGNHPKLKPSVEGGFGMAFGTGFANSVGVHIMAGMGFDYKLDNQMSLGTMIRLNLAPPLKTVFMSWPLIVFRMQI